jgi:hypothetical protein
VNSTTDFHNAILNIVFPTTNAVFDNTTDFHPTNGVLHHDSYLGFGFIILFLFLGQFFASWLFQGLAYFHTYRPMALKARILMKFDARWKGGELLITDGFIMNRSFIGFAQV